jgi:hypothetical protein
MRKAVAFLLCFVFFMLWGAAFHKGGDLSAQEAGAEASGPGTGSGEEPGTEEPEDQYPGAGEYPDDEYPDDDYPDDEYPEDDDEGIPSEDYTGYIPDMYTKGDQFFSVNLGLLIPTVFAGVPYHNLDIPDFTGFLSYNFFIDARWYVGGELGGMFAGTRQKNMLFIVPIGIRGGYQFVVGRFEFPVGAALGLAATRYLDHSYPGFYMKGGGSAYFRFNPDWSFGFNVYWWWVPQWFGDKKYNVDGNYLEITLSARYHF